MTAAITGLAALLNSSAIAFQTVKWLGVAYLLYLAWQTMRDKSALDVDDVAQPPASALRIITTAVLINFLNPKLPSSSSRSCPSLFRLVRPAGHG